MQNQNYSLRILKMRKGLFYTCRNTENQKGINIFSVQVATDCILGFCNCRPRKRNLIIEKLII